MIESVKCASMALVALWAGPLWAQSTYSFESGHVRPLALSPSKALLLAVNTSDNRIEIFQPQDGTLIRRGETVVGLEPVSVAARTEQEAFVVNHLSDSVSVVDMTDPDHPYVKATLLVGDEPRDVVIAGSRRNKVFITAAARGQNRPRDAAPATPGLGRADVWVFDAEDLAAPPRIVTLFCDSPRALAVTPDGRRVYAAAFLSGNRTTTLNELATDPSRTPLMGDKFAPPPLPPPDRTTAGVPAPRTGLIVRYEGDRWLDSAGQDWTPRLRFRLPDLDVFTIDADAEAPAVIGEVGGAGTVLFNMAVNPADGRVYVSNIESRNSVRFEPALRGHVVENRVTIIEGGKVRPVHLNPHIDYDSEGTHEEVDASLASPTGMEFSADGSKLYLCALSSGKVGVLDADGAVLNRIHVGDLPTGLVLHEAASRLYVMERLFQAVVVVDLEAEMLLEFVSLRYTPEPHRVREGVNYLYDARQSSAHGDAACSSCHIFGDRDGLAWDLGDPTASEEPNPLAPAGPLAGRTLAPFHPMKGPMMTQSLRGLAGAGPMHWRGDRNAGLHDQSDPGAAFMTFHGTFQKLLGLRSEFNDIALRKLRDFVLSIRYPPNPHGPIDGSATSMQAAGKQLFQSNGSPAEGGGDGNGCAECHRAPFGTDGRAAPRGQQAFKVPHLRNLYQKVGMFGYAPSRIDHIEPGGVEPSPTPFLGDQVSGFGYTHDGSVPTVADFLFHPLGEFSFPDEPGRTGEQKVRDLEAYLLAFPTGLAPAVGQQVTLTSSNLSGSLPRFELLLSREAAGDGDAVLHGMLRGVSRGWLLSRDGANGAVFLSSRASERYAVGDLLNAVSEGEAVLTLTLAPPGSGRRIAIDRDNDGALDGDELDLGTDPLDALSYPPPERPRIVRGDCSADGRLSISDAISIFNFLFRGGAAPPCRAACDGDADGQVAVSDGILLLRFLFRSGPAPGAYPVCEAVAEACPETCSFGR